MIAKKALFTSIAFLAVASATASFAEDVEVIQINSGSTSAGLNQSSQLIITIQQLQDEVRQLNGKIESQQYTINQLQTTQKERYRDLDRRISELMRQQSDPLAEGSDLSDAALASETQVADQPSSEQPDTATPNTDSNTVEKSQSVVKSPDVPTSTNPSEPSNTQPQSDADDQGDYQAAFALVRQRAFPEAIEKFSEFLATYPQSPRVANAHYWLGELYLATSDLELAETEFQTVVKAYPDSRKASDALYKLGILYKQKGDISQSFSFMERVVKEYPDSSAARLAESALQ